MSVQLVPGHRGVREVTVGLDGDAAAVGGGDGAGHDDQRAGAVDVGVAVEQVAGDRLVRPVTVGAPSVGSLTTNVVLPTALLAPLKVSLSATGGSLTQVTVTDTVAVDPPLRV